MPRVAPKVQVRWRIEGVFRRVAVVELTGDGKRPYFVLAWR